MRDPVYISEMQHTPKPQWFVNNKINSVCSVKLTKPGADKLDLDDLLFVTLQWRIQDSEATESET